MYESVHNTTYDDVSLIYGMGQKTGPQTHDHIILSNLNRLKKFFTGIFLGKFAVKCILKNLPHSAYVATLL